MDVGAISPNGDLYKKVYIHDITKWFCCGKKRTLLYHLMKSDHRIVYQKFCENKEKFWVLSKGQDDKLQKYKVQRWEVHFPAKSKEGYYDI